MGWTDLEKFWREISKERADRLLGLVLLPALAFVLGLWWLGVWQASAVVGVLTAFVAGIGLALVCELAVRRLMARQLDEELRRDLPVALAAMLVPWARDMGKLVQQLLDNSKQAAQTNASLSKTAQDFQHLGASAAQIKDLAQTTQNLRVASDQYTERLNSLCTLFDGRVQKLLAQFDQYIRTIGLTVEGTKQSIEVAVKAMPAAFDRDLADPKSKLRNSVQKIMRDLLQSASNDLQRLDKDGLFNAILALNDFLYSARESVEQAKELEQRLAEASTRMIVLQSRLEDGLKRSGAADHSL